MPNYINNSIYKARKQTATQFLMKMMSAGIRDKFNIKWELLTIMFFPPTFFLVAFPGGT